MTREEAVRQIRDNIDFRKRLQEGDKPQFFDADENEKDIEAFDMAIKALEQEPCDKCEVGNPCLYCKHKFEPEERSEEE